MKRAQSTEHRAQSKGVARNVAHKNIYNLIGVTSFAAVLHCLRHVMIGSAVTKEKTEGLQANYLAMVRLTMLFTMRNAIMLIVGCNKKTRRQLTTANLRQS